MDETQENHDADTCRHPHVLRTSAGTCNTCGERLQACPCGWPRSEQDPVLVLNAVFANGASTVVRSCAVCGTLYALAGDPNEKKEMKR